MSLKHRSTKLKTFADIAGQNMVNITQSHNTEVDNYNIQKVFKVLGKAEQRHRKLTSHILTTLHIICVQI